MKRHGNLIVSSTQNFQSKSVELRIGSFCFIEEWLVFKNDQKNNNNNKQREKKRYVCVCAWANTKHEKFYSWN